MRFSRTAIVLLAALALVAMMPAAAFALVNEYGMNFAGQEKCLECHDGRYGLTPHARFVKQGLVPGAPSGWTTFTAAGNVPAVGAAAPLSGAPWFSQGGSYPVGLNWMTLGDYNGGVETEYIFFNGNNTGSTKNPWNLVEGLVAVPGIGYEVGTEKPSLGLYDVVYSCQRCHMLGTTSATPASTSTALVPNPMVSKAATYTTPFQWSRPETTTVSDFNTSVTVSYPGMSIQCEACHGTGYKTSTYTTKHWDSGTQLSHRIPAGTVAASGTLPATGLTALLDSQVCGQCHGSYTNVTGTVGVYGFTPNLKLRDFVDVNGLSGGVSYTYTPTEAEFLKAPTKYFMFPNGSNAKGNHYYYDEWSASGHAYRGQLTSKSADALRYQKDGNGHYNTKSSGLTCTYCHTGEGYLKTKTAPIMHDFAVTTATAGFMGQECVTCHIPHPSGIGMELSLREPDAAGVRSNAGRTTSNTSVCEDCHNWQLEVQGLGVSFEATTSGRGPSHAQREILHGRSVMFEVPDAGENMPGVKCPDCHMPKTNKNANRISHGMHIMMPADAKSWNATAGATYKGEDSCSGCHKGASRDELQDNIETWQAEAKAAAAEASAAIDAAKLRAEFATAGGKQLAGRAFVNWRAYVNDGSYGAHNPAYVVRGLVAAKRLAKSVGGGITPYASASVRINTMGYVAGNFTNGDGTKAADAKVALLHYVGTAWVQEQSSATDANGNVSFLVAVPTAGNQYYKLRWDRSGNDVSDMFSAVKVMVVTKIPSTTSVKVSATSIYYGKTVTVSGVVSPAAPGKVVTIQRKFGTGSWVNLTTATLGSTSAYAKAVKPSARGAWYFRTYYPGSATVAPSYSGYLKVTVK